MAESIPANRNHNFQDLTGRRFGKLLVVAYAGRTRRGNSLWQCLCDCGEGSVTETKNLRIGKATSCGCVGRSRLAIRNTSQQVIDPSGKIILAGGHVCLVDPEDLLLVSQYNWHAHKSRTTGRYYARSNEPKMLMHTLLMGAKGVDHRNGNGLDNRRENLRLATRHQNARNSVKPRTSGNKFKGVVPPRNRTRWWRTRIAIDGRQVTFGRFGSEEEAARAYDQRAKEAFGEFARLNFPEGP